MLKNNIDVDIPFETVCTLQQACEYLAFGWEPTNNKKYEAFLKRERSYGEVHKPEYDCPMAEAKNTLIVLFEHDMLPMTGIADPGEPFLPENCDATILKNDQLQEFYEDIGYPTADHPRVLVEKPADWYFDFDNNWVMNRLKYDTSYRDIQIQLTDLKKLCAKKQPTKHYTVSLRDDGSLMFTDGTASINIATLRIGGKKYNWLKHYFDHAGECITKQKMIDIFKDTAYPFQNGDRITSPVYGAFSGNETIMHACFPELSDKQIICKPNFTDLDIQK